MSNLTPKDIETASIYLNTAISTGQLSKQAVREIEKILRASLVPSGSLDGKKLLTPKEAADLLSISTRTIHRYHHNGDIVGIYLRKGSPKSLRFSLSELARLGAGGNSNE